MPELPEAETIVRGLRSVLPGARIARIEVLHADVLRQEPEAFRGRLRDRVIRDVERRGKNVVLNLDGEAVLLVNLGMTGRLLPRAADAPPTSHPALRFHLGEEHPARADGAADGPDGPPAAVRVLVYDDVRRFGAVEALGPAEWRERSASLGPEPLEPSFDVDRLARGLARSRAPVRSWLLDQRKVAGVGNIYANEALHRAGIDPRRRARALADDEVAALHEALRATLDEAIRARGTTIRDYRDASGDAGSFGASLRVYGREGEACDRCGGSIRRVVFGGRSAFLCPACQPAREEA